MNTPRPDLISKIASSSQTVAGIEEHNVVNSAANFNPVLSVTANGFPPSFSGANTIEHGSRVAEAISESPSSFQGVKNPGSLVAAPLFNNSAMDSKGLLSALEANSALSSRVLRRDQSLEGTGDGSAILVTAEELGFVENLYLWLEERLSEAVVGQWGVTPGTKRVANLWSELVEGESSLEDCRPPRRTTHVARVKIRNEKGLVLVESHQEMSDGRRRARNRALAEKMKPGENVEEACLRGIFEELGAELGASERVSMVPESYTREQEERDSISYPGLPTLFVIHSMEACIQQLPSTEFSTEENESHHGGSTALNGDTKQGAVGVKRHFWRWVPEWELAAVCNS